MSARTPAPGDLALIQALINTLDIESGRDDLTTAGGMAAFLSAHDLPGAPVGPEEVAAIFALRAGLRALAAVNAGLEPDRDAFAILNEVGARAPLVVSFEPSGGARLGPAIGGVASTVARLLGIVHDSMVRGTWERLKVCRNESCRWAFYDRSKNHSGRWCTMDVCGNLMKARAYRARARAG